MKGSLKIWMVILGILAAGTGITCLTNSYVTRQIAKMAETQPHRQEYTRVLPEEESADSGQGMAEDALPEAIEEGAPVPHGEDAKGDAMPRAAAIDFASAGTVPDGEAAPAGTAPEDEAAPAGTVSEDEAAPARAVPEGEDFASAKEAAEDAKAFDGERTGEDAGELPQADKAKTADIGQAPLAERAAQNAPAGEVVLEITEYPTDLQEGLKEYQERFPQIDRQIEQMRKSETENNVYSVKTAAQTEQRIWEREMEGIYRLLCDSLDAMACEKLKKEQQEWVQLRDSLAEEAAKKNSGGSLESVDYIASIASSNRERAYALLEKYQE